MRQSPILIESGDNLNLCDYWSVVGKRDDNSNHRNLSRNFCAPSQTTTRGKIRKNPTSDIIIPKLIIITNASLKCCSIKPVTFVF